MKSTLGDGSHELLGNLLVAILPNVQDARIVAVTMGDAIWDDVLWDREVEEELMQAGPKAAEEEDDDDVFVSGYEDMGAVQKRDWVGVDRDRRSAFLIIGALKQEGLL